MSISPTATDNQTYDLLIIGAGINGAGIARDAAMRGLNVLLLDKGDISAGTSSWSTRLIHGGLRYLEHGEIRHVRESLRERERLLRIASHLVKPIPLLIPIYKKNRRGKLAIRLGMVAYDLLSFGKTLKRHRMLSSKETIERAPCLNQDGLLGGAEYFDAQVEFAERLVLENAISAVERGAHVRTYSRVDELIVEKDRVVGVRFSDLLQGGAHLARAKMTINVSGPWVDEVLSHAGCGIDRQVGGTKGSHIVVERFPGAPDGGLYVEASEDGRPFFIIPWNGLCLIGTTNLPYDGDLDRVNASEEEIDYLLRETNRRAPSSKLERRSILFTYSGVRPLPYVREGDPASITRRYFIHDHAPTLEGIVSIVGGKLTTYRSLSEEVVDLVLKKLGRKAVRCRTDTEYLPGAGPYDYEASREQFASTYGLPASVSARLFRIYGTRAERVIEEAKRNVELFRMLGPDAIEAEIVYAFSSEMALTLTDCLMRRTMLGWSRTLALDLVVRAADVARLYFGWDKNRYTREIDDYQQYVSRFQ